MYSIAKMAIFSKHFFEFLCVEKWSKMIEKQGLNSGYFGSIFKVCPDPEYEVEDGLRSLLGSTR